MELNNIKLNPSAVVDLYKNFLVEVEDPAPQQQIIASERDAPKFDRASTEWKHLGEFRKKILLIVKYRQAPFLPDEALNFLTSVLGACKLGLGDVAIVNLEHTPSAVFKDIQQSFVSTHFILFGVTPQEIEMPVSFPEFQVQAFNGCIYLHTPVLEQLETDKVLKSKLWVCLRRMLGV